MSNWPDKFVYVCSIGQAAVVNALPLVHAGLARVAEIVVFCGARSEDTENTTDLSQAVNPMREFVAIMRKWCPSSPIKVLYGDPDNMAVWYRHTLDIARATTPERPIVLNLTGGRKQMSLGALSGWLNAPANARHLIFVAGKPLGVDFVDIATMEQSPAAANQELTLDQYLNLYGMREIAPADRREKTQLHHDRKAIVEQFAAQVMPKIGVVQAILDKAARARQSADGRNFTQGLVDPWEAGVGTQKQRQFAADSMRIFAGHAGLSEANNDNGQPVLHASTQDGVDMLRGGWFETLVFNRLEQHFQDRNGVALLPNVRVAYTTTTALNPGAEIGEFDIAVMIQSQLHIVETKAAHISGSERGGMAKALAQIDKWKRSLLGQFGRIIVVQPRQTLEELETRGSTFLDRADHAGADLALGPDATDRTIALLEHLSQQHFSQQH